MSIDLSPVYSHLNTGLELLASGLALYAVWKVREWVNSHMAWLSADTKSKLTAELETVLNEAIAWGLQQLEGAEKSHPSIQTPAGVKGFVIGHAAQYAVDHAEGELEGLGVSPEMLAQKLLAKLPAISTSEDTTGGDSHDQDCDGGESAPGWGYEIMHWALIVFALCGNPGGYFSCPAQIAKYPTLSQCQNELQEFGLQIIDGKTWHQRHLYSIWCEPR